MGRSKFRLDEDSVSLPRGTRVVLRVDIPGSDGFVHRQASVATVKDSNKFTYRLETPSGRTLVAERDQITVQRRELLEDLGRRAWDFEQLAENIIYAGIVGSRAWGLAGPDSDTDVRGCFVLPFDDHVSLWNAPDEIQDPNREAAYWEIEKLIHQGLRGDANTLESLWTPLHQVVTPLGQMLIDRRRMFVSMNVLGSFGRYAQSQFKKIERSLARNATSTALLDEIAGGRVTTIDEATDKLGVDRGEIVAIVRSTFDRGLIEGAVFDELLNAVRAGRRDELEPPPHRPKNAYNLLRLLHSCLSWLRTGEPLITVEGELHSTLLEIKGQRTPIEETLRLAQRAAEEIDAAVGDATLPEAPDYEAADELLTECRRVMARRHFRIPPCRDDLEPTLLPVELPDDVDPVAMRRFLEERGQPAGGRTIWIALSGAHAYGFPSVDSDLDVKGTFIAPLGAVIGFGSGTGAIDYLGDFAGREYDLTLNELTRTVRSILGGNGNYIERLLGPLPLLTTELGHRLRTLTQASLSRRVHGHYRGFMRSIQKRYDEEASGGVRKAKRLLYVFRTGLTGLHLLRTGAVETRAPILAELYEYDGVAELVRIKQTQEGVCVDEEAAAGWLDEIRRLEVALDAAVEKSVLPVDPPNAAALEDLAIEVLRRPLFG